MRYVSIPSFIRSAVKVGWSWARIAQTLNATGCRTTVGEEYTEDDVLILAIGIIAPDVIALPDLTH